jgi:protein TIF31
MEKADAAVSMCPPPRLGQFYEFFSFSHLTPPVQCQLSFSLEL